MNRLIIYYLQIAFITFTVLQTFVELYLLIRQKKEVARNRGEVPQDFQSIISLADHQKAADYTQAKILLAIPRHFLELFLFLYWFPFRGLDKLQLWAQSFQISSISQDILLLVAFMAIQAVIFLPFKLYSTFVIEEKFGFNRMTLKMMIVDGIKGLLVSAVLGLPLLAGLLYVYKALGTYWWIYAWILMTCFQFTVIWVYPKWIAPLFNKFIPLEDLSLKTELEKLVANTGHYLEDVYVMDASKRSGHGNAYFTGLGKNKRVVFFDTLLKTLSNNETLAVLAHELGHLKHKHILKSLITSLIFSFLGLALMGYLSTKEWFYLGHFNKVQSAGSLFLIFSTAMGVYSFWFTPLQSFLSRKKEFEADAYAAKERPAEDMVSALLKLYKDNSSTLTPDELYANFYYSHPHAAERIKHLRLNSKN